MPSPALARYKQYLKRLPAPGGGGAHRAIYAAGCLGLEAGLAPESVIKDIRENLPSGSRYVPDREIEDGVSAAYASTEKGLRKPACSKPKVAPALLHDYIRRGRGATMDDISARSTVKPDWRPESALQFVLEALYRPDEWLFLGDDHTPGMIGRSIRMRDYWVKSIVSLDRHPWPKWIPNPLTGKPATKKSGAGTTLRGDGCVASYRFAVVEHDQLPLADQLAFWMASPLPVSALIYSGKKSIHGLVRVDCAHAVEWDEEVRGKLFPQYLIPMGFDPACQNPSRLSRCPGHRRQDTGLIQSCIYLAPEGKAVSA